jgi:hypothetical protein
MARYLFSTSRCTAAVLAENPRILSGRSGVLAAALAPATRSAPTTAAYGEVEGRTNC